MKTIEEINEKIKNGEAIVLTADEMTAYVQENGAEKAAKEIDVVTTGTFGAMCSSGAFLNFGHSDPPIKMQRIWLNDVEAHTGLAAVDAYLGATQVSETRGFDYGGGHVIEDLLKGEELDLRATAYGTYTYPRKSLETRITLNDLNQAVLLNPRNTYQKYPGVVNSTSKTIHTYLGSLKPDFGNLNFSGAGELNPLCNDPTCETIGFGTRIFLGGGIGYVIGEGTQHSPGSGFGTLSVKGDLKQMSSEYLKGARIYKYGCSLFVGIGVPIPILNEKIARSTGISDSEIFTDVLDYGVARRVKPVLKSASYAELKSGKVELNDEDVPSHPVCSLPKAKQITRELKEWIENGEFLLSRPLEKLPLETKCNPMKER